MRRKNSTLFLWKAVKKNFYVAFCWFVVNIMDWLVQDGHLNRRARLRPWQNYSNFILQGEKLSHWLWSSRSFVIHEVCHLLIFFHFFETVCRDLRCLRNTIHINLFLTYILSIFLWLLTITLQVKVKTGIFFRRYLQKFLIPPLIFESQRFEFNWSETQMKR